MKRQTAAAGLLTLGMAWTVHTALAAGEMCSNGANPEALNLCTSGEMPQGAAALPPKRSSFVERAFQTRVGTHGAAMDPQTREELCAQGNAAREAMALHLAARLDQDGADGITRGNMVERKVKLKLPCA